MWKKNYSFFGVFVLLFICEIPYITTIVDKEDKFWYQQINYVYIVLLALPSICALCFIVFKRIYMPKAKKGTKGIAVYIINANDKQYEAIKRKFINEFQKSVNCVYHDYSVVSIDDYHSKKYYSLLYEPSNEDGKDQAKVLKKRNCQIAILIDCINGGDGEDLFCRMTTNVGVAHKTLFPIVRNLLIQDISIAFKPLLQVDINKVSETSDLTRYSVSMDVLCKYVFASICFHCGDFVGTLKQLEDLRSSIQRITEIPPAITPIKEALFYRFAVCYKAQAQYEYQLFCNDHQEIHLIAVQQAIKNEYCKRIFANDNKILEGICSFVLDKNITYAMQCMDAYSKKDPIVKFNKAFLFLYKQCSVNNIGRAYNTYKTFDTLPNYLQEQIESFTYNEYQKDPNKKQLLLILFFIYDYQNNDILAKRCLEQFYSAFPWVQTSELGKIFIKFTEKYAKVKYEDKEYCI